MKNYSPGFNPQRLVSLMQDAIGRCQLQLHGKIVLTEAATGAYAVTPVLAAMAGAEKVFAIAQSSRYGTVEEVIAQTEELAKLAGVGHSIEFLTEKTKEIVALADIITNSGHVRPIDAETISWMKPSAVIPLMYEAWEFRPEDLDLIACRECDIKVAGTNERHPAVDVFSFLGIMAIKLLLDAGVSAYTSNILLLCDNPFRSFIERGLINAGARVDTVETLSDASPNTKYDAILVALQPRPKPVLSETDALLIANQWSGAIVAQYWGDIKRSAFLTHNIPIWPEEAPKPGHMGILPSEVGPEATIRLQIGGLKVGEVLLRSPLQPNDPDKEYIQLL
jgi:hypothetical protein